MKPAASRFAYLDALRGFAALAVLYFHSGYDALNAGRLDQAWERSVFWVTSYGFDLGKIAVTLFFAVSGFVIPFSLKRDGHKPVKSFIVGRFFRLYPAYWVSILGAILVNYWMIGTNLSLFTLLSNITMMQGFVGQPSMQGLYWTLQIEIIFYALCVVLFLFADLRNAKVSIGVAAVLLLGALAAGYLRYVTGKALPVAIPLALFVMFVGLLWRLATVENNCIARRGMMILLPCFALVMPAVAKLAYADEALRYIATYFIAIGIFLLFTTKIKLQGFVLSFLGRISFSIYLFGSLVQKAFEHYLAAGWQGMGLPLHLAIAGMMAITVAIAALVYRFVEAPAIKRGKSIIGFRLRSAPKAADAVAL